EPLGGNGDGIIGALAAVGLLATQNGGRVVYLGRDGSNLFDVEGCLSLADILARGVDRVVSLTESEPRAAEVIDLRKRLRPNLRDGQVVLYVSPSPDETGPPWLAERVIK